MTDRTLVLLRHAKAERPGAEDDIDRRLTGRGHDDAAAAGAWLAAQRLRPDLVLCSPARRTRETWHAVVTALGQAGSGVSTRYEPRLYSLGGTRDLLDLVTGVAEPIRVLLLIGHNPTLSMLSATLDPEGSPDDGLRTAGVAVHRLSGDWVDYAHGVAPLAAAHTARAAG
jgi:phosphohistidine phosphatase